MFRISVFVSAFLLLACCVLPMAAQQPPVTGTGTPNHIAKWITSTKLGNSGIFETAAGNVGIGSTTPSAKLDLHGTEDVRDTLTLFPKSTHPTLSVKGTAFAVSSTGKVTFVAGQKFPGAGTVTKVNSGAGLTGGPITTTGTLSIASGGVTNTMLAHPSLTVTAGTGLSGGGAVALGSSVTLNNSGVLSVTTGSGITNTGGQNPTLGIDTSVVPTLAGANFFSGFSDFDGNEPGWEVEVSNAGGGDAIIASNTSADPSHPTLSLTNNDFTDAGDLALDVLGPSFGGECSIDVTGNLFCTGTLGAAVKQGIKRVGLYTMQSSESWIEDFGSGALAGGVATIRLEPHFARTVSGQADYHVFLTPAGECEGLYITNRTATSFQVRELKNGTSSVAFDYRIVAHRKGFETSRLPDLTKRFGKKVVQSQTPKVAQR
jgi:hypothetical protein